MSMAEHSESQHKAQRRAGLGRGLGALIPQAQSENPEEVAKRPLDVSSLVSVQVRPRGEVPRANCSNRRLGSRRVAVVVLLQSPSGRVKLRSRRRREARKAVKRGKRVPPRYRPRPRRPRKAATIKTMFHVKHRNLCRYQVRPLQRFLWSRSFLILVSRVKCLMKMI